MSSPEEPPKTMLSLHLPQTYGTPSSFVLSHLPRPTLTTPTSVEIRVLASSLNPIDVKAASGIMRLIRPDSFPYRIGYDVSGIITSLGSSSSSSSSTTDSKFKVGDEVICRLPHEDKGSFSEYVVTDATYLAHKPKNLSHEEAACLPLVGMTGLQAYKRYIPNGIDGLKDKTVFVPGALGGAGMLGIQIAKILGAKEVITSVSTSKVQRTKELLQPDRIIDYKKQKLEEEIEKKSVDFVYDTTGETLNYLPLIKEGGTCISIATSPSGDCMKEAVSTTPFYAVWLLNFTTRKYYKAAKKAGVNYDYIFFKSIGEDLALLSKWAEEGKLKPIVGEVVDWRNKEVKEVEEKVKEACERQFSGKGSPDGGKIVFRISD